jgi:hypothetical protein
MGSQRQLHVSEANEEGTSNLNLVLSTPSISTKHCICYIFLSCLFDWHEGQVRSQLRLELRDCKLPFLFNSSLKMKVKSADVQVYCNHKPAREYESEDLEQEEVDTIKQYIEVKSGARFDVRCTIDNIFAWNEADVVNLYVYIDGKSAAGTCILKKSWSTDRRPSTVNGVWATKDGQNKFLNFTFDDLETRA